MSPFKLKFVHHSRKFHILNWKYLWRGASIELQEEWHIWCWPVKQKNSDRCCLSGLLDFLKTNKIFTKFYKYLGYKYSNKNMKKWASVFQLLLQPLLRLLWFLHHLESLGDGDDTALSQCMLFWWSAECNNSPEGLNHPVFRWMRFHQYWSRIRGNIAACFYPELLLHFHLLYCRSVFLTHSKLNSQFWGFFRRWIFRFCKIILIAKGNKFGAVRKCSSQKNAEHCITIENLSGVLYLK